MKTKLRRRPNIGLLALVTFLPVAGQAQFLFTTNSGALTITGYTGSGGSVVVPSATNGYPVTSIGPNAFSGKSAVTSVTLPNSITSIGDNAFYSSGISNINIPGSVVSLGTEVCGYCSSLATVTLGDGLTSIGTNMFDNDWRSLLTLVVPNSVTSIGPGAFNECESMTNIVLSANLTSIGAGAFGIDYALTAAYFLGNAPFAPTNLFQGDTLVTVYYLPHTAGWTNKFGGAPAVLWTPPLPTLGITTYSNQPVILYPYESIGTYFQVQMTTNLSSGNWLVVTNGVRFIAVQITNAPSPAFFRLQ